MMDMPEGFVPQRYAQKAAPARDLLTPRAESDTIPSSFDWRAFGEMQLLTLQTQINFWRKKLNRYPKCPHCGGEVK